MDLNEIRLQIDDIDEQILKLFCERMNLVRQVAEFKFKNNMPILRQDRENEILQRVRHDADDISDGYGEYAANLFERLMEVSRNMQQNIIEKESK